MLELQRYDELFSALASLIYLPVFMVENSDRVQEFEVSTDLYATKDENEVRQTIAKIGVSRCVFRRTIRCLPVNVAPANDPSLAVCPPAMEFMSNGYWRNLEGNAIGKDKDGNAVVGKTWVIRIEESFVAKSPESFILHRSASVILDDPNIVLSNENKDRALVGEVITMVALSGHICREFNVSDHGIDMEVEFKSNEGEATGSKVYLQLKSGDSHLKFRKHDQVEVFQIKDERHARYWMKQRFNVILLIRDSTGKIRWMEIRDWLRLQAGKGNNLVKQIPFQGASFTVRSVIAWHRTFSG